MFPILKGAFKTFIYRSDHFQKHFEFVTFIFLKIKTEKFMYLLRRFFLYIIQIIDQFKRKYTFILSDKYFIFPKHFKNV